MRKGKISDELEVLVDFPVTDGEMIEHLFLGIKPERRPVRMSYGDLRSVRNFARVVIAGILLTGAVLAYSSAIQEHGSLSKAYNAFMQQGDDMPPGVYAGCP